MIFVTRLNNKSLAINPDLIETLEETPDTVIMLTNGNKYVVADSIDEIIKKIIEYRKKCYPENKGDIN